MLQPVLGSVFRILHLSSHEFVPSEGPPRCFDLVVEMWLDAQCEEPLTSFDWPTQHYHAFDIRRAAESSYSHCPGQNPHSRLNQS